MMVNLSQTLNLVAPEQAVWALLRDTGRLGALVPGIESIVPDDVAGFKGLSTASIGERFKARVIEKVGPFHLSMNLEINLVEVVEPSKLTAEITGVDGGGQNRMKGTLSAELKKADQVGTLLTFNATVEVLGKLASLGAVPIRRRANELFAEFASRVEHHLLHAQRNPSGDETPQV